MHRSDALACGDASHGVIVGTAIGYGFPQIEEFLKSLRRSGYRGEIVMTLARTLPQGDREWLSRFGVTPYFVRESPWIAQSRDSRTRAPRCASLASFGHTPLGIRLAVTLQGPISRRWALCPVLAAEFPATFERAPWVFQCDVRDVHFQADPSETLTTLCANSPLHFYAEGEPHATASSDVPANGALLIRDQPDNRSWIAYAAGEAAAADIEHKQVLCAGTVVARPERLLELSERMIAGLTRPRVKGAPIGLDQGVLNFLYHTGALDDLDPVVHANAEGAIFTVGMCSDDGWTFDKGSLRVGNEVPSVVHQFDRVPTLPRSLGERSSHGLSRAGRLDHAAWSGLL